MVILVGLLATIAVPQYLGMRERALISVLQSDLRQHFSWQEQAFDSLGTYVADPATLAEAPLSPRVRLGATQLGGARWLFATSHPGTRVVCWGMMGVDAPRGEPRVNCSGAATPTDFSVAGPASVALGESITLDASDGAAGTAQMAWVLGDGEVAGGDVAEHTTISHTWGLGEATAVALAIGADGAVRVGLWGGVGGTGAPTTPPPPPPPAVPPTAAMTLSSETTERAATVTADAGGSTPGSSPIVSWAWTWGDGQTSQGVTVTHSWALSGTYPVTLTVTDAEGRTATANATVTVTAPAHGIEGSLVVNGGPVGPGEELTLDTSGSRGAISSRTLYYEIPTDPGNWRYMSLGAVTPYRPSLPGVHRFRLIVRNSTNTAADTVVTSTTVATSATQMKAVMSISPAAAGPWEEVILDGSGSSSWGTAGAIRWVVHYQWPDEPNPPNWRFVGSSAVTSIRVNRVGTWPVRLIVNSSYGVADTTYTSFTINPSATQVQARMSISPESVVRGGAVGLDASTSTTSGTAGPLTYYYWSYVRPDDPNQNNWRLIREQASAVYTPLVAGNHRIRLIVRSAAGVTDTLTRNLTVTLP